MVQRNLPPQKCDTLETRFSGSLERFAERNRHAAIGCAFDTQVQRLAAAARTKADLWPLFGTVARAMGKQHLAGTVQNIITGCAQLCESPIELAMCFAIGLGARAQNHCVLYDLSDVRIYGDAEGDTTVRIQPQVVLGPYRVDLLVTLQMIEGPRDRPAVHSRQVIVECDGFEHHDRTREQAIRDRERDRYLQSLGLNVFRYAGAEIWADVFQCAEQVLDFLASGVEVMSRKPPGSVPAEMKADALG